jgi:hypothetical protein
MNNTENYIKIVNIQGKYKEIINWLAEYIEDCKRQNKKGLEGLPEPYDFSAISQYARFRGYEEQWKLEVHGQKPKITVWFKNTVDSKIVIKFLLKWTRVIDAS